MVANRLGVYDPLERNGERPPAQRGGAPPFSEEAEMGVLGSMIMAPREALPECVDRLTEKHFFIPRHQTTFGVLADLYQKRKAVDLITFTQELRDRKLLDEVGGAGWVTSLFTFVPTAANVEYYVDILREKNVAREIISKCTELVRIAHDEQTEIGDALEKTQAALIQIIMDSEKPDVFRHVKEGMAVAIDQLEHAYANRGKAAVNGLATGIIDLDRMTSGLLPQQLMIVGARPSQGKSALAMNFAANMAIKNQVPVAVFSMEMSYQEIVNRLLCSQADVSLQRFRDGMLGKADFARVPEHASRIGAAPIWIDDTPALNIGSFRARARLLRTRYGVRAIIVDYLQLMHSSSKRAEEARWLEITEISQALKATAKELAIPIICCAQLNREAEARKGDFGKPKRSDLRESGSIENDADIVALLWRPERHIQHARADRKKIAGLLKLTTKDGNQKIELWQDEKELSEEQVKERDYQIDHYAALILAKQRNGPVGEIRLTFEGDLTRFDNVTQKTWSNRQDERQEKNE
jgi:replicative DNA helicase